MLMVAKPYFNKGRCTVDKSHFDEIVDKMKR